MNEKLQKWIYIGIILIILYYVYTIFIKKPLPPKKILPITGTDWKKLKGTVLSGKELSEISKQIHDSMHFMGVGVKDTQLQQAFNRIQNKRQLSQIINMYSVKYKKNLILDLTDTLTSGVANKNIFGGGNAYDNIIDYINKLE
jgi:hypothetical protein